jgi:hypothetical protein
MLTLFLYLYLAAVGIFVGYLVRRLPVSGKFALASLSGPLLGYYLRQAYC